MPTNRYWLGGAPVMAQQVTFTVTAADSGTPSVFTFTIGGQTISVTSLSTTALTAAAIQAALAASTIPQFAEVSWTYPGSGSSFSGTMGNAGETFVITNAVTGSGTGAITQVATVANSGPNDISVPSNWSGGVLPAVTLAPPTGVAVAPDSGGSLTIGTTYYYVVTARNIHGETVASAEVNTGVIASGFQTADVSWNVVAGATKGYRVYRGTSPGSENVLVTNLSSPSATAYTDTGGSGGGASPPMSNAALGDIIVVDGGLTQQSMLYSLDTFGAMSIPGYIAYGNYQGTIGLPAYNTNGYTEYRALDLQFGGTLPMTLTEVQGPQLQAGSRQYAVLQTCVATCSFTGQGNGTIGQGLTYFRSTTGNANIVNSIGASLTIAALSSQTAAVTTLTASQNSAILCGPGLTAVTTINLSNSTLDIQSNVTTMRTNGTSQIACRNSMTVGTFAINGGTVVYNSTGAITTLTVGSESVTGTIDFSQGLGAINLSANTIDIYAGSTFNDPLSRTYAAGLVLTCLNGDLSSCTLEFGLGRTLSVS